MNKEKEEKINYRHVLEKEKKYLCTSFPKRHFRAMMRKERISWIRHWKRSIAEVIFPCIIYFVLSQVRDHMPIIRREFNTDLMRWANTIFPFPNPSRYGGKATEEDQESYDLREMVSAA